MACPVCPAVGWLGGWIGGYFGIQSPPHFEGKVFSAVITANLISLTVIALKAIFDVSLCGGGGATLGNVAKIAVKTLVMGIIYSIGVNYLLNHYVFPQSENNQNLDDSPDDSLLDNEIAVCCCKCEKANI